MATKLSGGTAKNLRDSNPKFLGVKRADGQTVKTGEVIVRQRGSAVVAGKNVGMGTDHTLFALANGKVTFSNKRKKSYDGSVKTLKSVSIVPHTAK